MRKNLLGLASPVALILAMAASGAASAAGAPGAAAAQGADQGADQGATPGAPAVKNPATTVQEVVVTGLRASLRSSERIKRDSNGVVDAITAEDIGKFPDTNLAESIQRIPGVTIDRDNNEGSRVTVRGFGPEYNLVTLNGRSMPGAINENSASATRSFDFEELSSDAIAGVAVYKTGRADVPSGGIGATIDITTARPFDYNGMRTAFSVKETDDTSTLHGVQLTPEVSGLFSNQFFGGKLGLLVDGSYSVRDSYQQNAFVGGWLEDQVCTTQNQAETGCGALSPNITNNQTIGTHNYAPQSMQWAIDQHHRDRANGQAVLQFRPVDSLVITTDYTYALFQDHLRRNEYSAWFGYGGSLFNGALSKDGTLNQFNVAGNDLAYDSFDDHFRNELGSTGVNVKWKASDSLEVAFDAHHSYSASGGDPQGNNDFFIVGQDQTLSLTKSFDGTHTTIPLVGWTYKPPYAMGNMNTSTVTPLFGQANNNVFDTAIDEMRLDTTWRNTDDSALRSIQFGVQYKDMSTNARSYNSFDAAGFYDPANDGLIPASKFSKVSTCGLLQGVSGGGCQQLVPYFYTFNVASAVAATASKYGYTFGVPTTPTNNDNIDEKTMAGYAQMNLDTRFNGMRFRAVAGVRYETTDVTARSLVDLPTGISWDNPTEFHTLFASNPSFSDVKKNYGEFLPNIDASLEVLRGVLLRASYSKTITRSDLTEMVGTEAVTTTPKIGARTAVAGNPGLLPYESQNFDAAAEWYYKRDSYVSFNYFEKHVTNFLTQTITKEPINGANGKPITDPAAGAIEQKAVTEVTNAGLPATPQNVFNQMMADTGQTSFLGQPGDPPVTWDVTTPSNANAVELHGIEMAIQHVFGETGFGFQANVSLPMGGANVNPLVIGNQFALPGLSKSYNIVAFYEKYGFQTRLAYTWRDHFLAGLSQGQGPNEPINTAAYGQLDMSASYDLSPHAVIFLDGINLTGASIRQYGRFTDQFLGYYQGNARLQVGVRFKF